MTLQYSDVIFYHCFEINSGNSAEKNGAYVNNQLHASMLKSAGMRLDMNQAIKSYKSSLSMSSGMEQN